ncbi:MAG: hypothetical protein LC768_13620 [Acidobacteria bacterium]|nr:hypothetical protein [Acidobacteriota bacterium]MCA1639349.1 hypothetical protein [Acidobacteriota bacterium]
MNTATEIKSEIDKTQSRIAELETQRNEQTAAFEAAQQGFIAGKVDSDTLHQQLGKLTLFEQTIESLKAMYQKLKSTFESQSKAEARRTLLDEMKKTAYEVEPKIGEYQKIRAEFDAVCAEYAAKMVVARDAYQNKQAEYRAIVAELEPTNEEIQQSGLDQQTRTRAAATYFNHPPLEYDRATAEAEGILAAKLHKAVLAKSRAEFNVLAAERANQANPEAARASGPYSL